MNDKDLIEQEMQKKLNQLENKFEFLFWQSVSCRKNKTHAKIRFYRRIPKANGDLRKIQMILTNFLKIFDKFCKKYEIKYYLNSGNAIGAVRHGGFIPWDDDIDIGMSRSDLTKLEKIIENSDFILKETYNLRLGLRHSKLYYKPHISELVHIDIFPTCTYATDLEPNEINKLYHKETNQLKNDIKTNIPDIYKKYVTETKNIYVDWVNIENEEDRDVINSIYAAHSLKNLNGSKKYEGREVGTFFTEKTISFSPSIIGNTKRIKFENIYVPAPEKINEYLELLYGDIYCISRFEFCDDKNNPCPRTHIDVSKFKNEIELILSEYKELSKHKYYFKITRIM